MREEIKQIMERFSKSSAMYLKINLSDDEILEVEKKQFSKAGNKGKVNSNLKTEAKIEEIFSKDVGHFTFGANKITKGMAVTSKTILGVVDSMGITHDIPSPFAGIVEDVCVEEGDVVEYGQVLFIVKEEI